MTLRRVAIVTGASRGIGRAIALRLAKDGFSVVVNYHTNAVKAQEVVDEITALPSKTECLVRAMAIQADAGNPADGKRLLDETIKAFGRLDIIVLHAGWAGECSIHDLTEDMYLTATTANIKGPIFLAKASQPYLLKAQEEADAVKDSGSPLGGSRIIITTTSATGMSNPGGGVLLYSVTKQALEQVARVLARDEQYGAKGITVNSVAPGPILTEGLRSLPPGYVEVLADQHPQKRNGEVDEVANVVSFLASGESSWVNGQNIGVSGGWTV
ncbi:hypothetical protein BGZ70_000153 [Mortierella alpina]|uniref:Uncharacterized protein n=1 Tax=Mortierella alpina TaxID=64518 RepID=A0A9P6IYE2_MORAP|nr:hypothetical protein BGZ70_000153 [Mortierella alpina]